MTRRYGRFGIIALMALSIFSPTLSEAANDNSAKRKSTNKFEQNELRKRAVRQNTPEAALKAAQAYESIFLANMLQNMQKDIPIDPDFGGGFAEEIFRELLVDEYAKLMSVQGLTPLASDIQKRLMAQAGIMPKTEIKMKKEVRNAKPSNSNKSKD
jgi:Rod binding domain-containing protein